MKDNFQGPTQYNVAGQSQHGNYSGQGAAAHQPGWIPVGQQAKPQSFEERRPMDKRPEANQPDEYKRGRYSPHRNPRPVSPGRNIPRSFPEGNRRGSPGKTFSAGDRRVSPSRLGPPVREFSPSGERPGRRISPGRRVSPGRRISPQGRRMSPPGRKLSPGRRISPQGRRISPPGRLREEPRRMSPSDRMTSRRESPPRRAGSPSRPHSFAVSRLGDKPSDKFLDDGKGPKSVRPAYEPSQAQNQTYTGGYRGNEGRYQPSRQADSLISPWQNEKIIFPSSMSKEDDRRDMGRRLEKDKSPRRQSRSPLRRERSPLKDRYRRHSPSPRSSRSPRRSWALEKRSSPPPIREPPPPPIWPGPELEDKPRKSRFEEDSKHTPVWDRLDRRPDESRSPFDDKLRARTDHGDKFGNRREFDYRGEIDRKSLERDRDFYRPEFSLKDSPKREDKKDFSDIDKDFQDIYKRAVEFRKKTEERKSGERRREEFNDRRREEDRPYRREESPRRRSLDREDIDRPSGEWNTKDRKRMFLSPTIKSKRDKAIEEITTRILDEYDIHDHQKSRINEELTIALSDIFLEMFSDKDVSFIELIIKYQAKYPPKEEDKLMEDVLSRLPSHYRNLKRKAKDSTEVPAKTSRRSPPHSVREETARPKLSDAVIPEWSTNIDPPKVMSLQLLGNLGINAINSGMNIANPGMVPAPVYLSPQVDLSQQHLYQQQQFSTNAMLQQQAQFDNSAMQQSQFGGNTVQSQFGASTMQHLPQFSGNTMPHQLHFSSDAMQQQQQFEPPIQEQPNNLYNLFLCQDDFEPFSEVQSEYLKNFLVSQIVKESSRGSWAPDITLKGLQSLYRYELTTKDEMSKDWILNLDFSDFEYFNVLVYTKEELWYERAAIWLPGHSRGRNIEPLEKLRMQNKRLDGVNLAKWKFVKKVVTVKGTRLYVDMPPSSARALEKHKMLLSYELQKVNVFLKAVAVDKETFDAGLKEMSITDPSLLVTAVQNSPMPTLNANTEPGIVKVGLSGQKSLSMEQCRKIKEVVVYFLFKYHQDEGTSRTDFIKFGYCPPCHLGIVPENPDSKRWLKSRHLGKMKRHNIVVFGDDDDNTRYFKMTAYIPHEYHSSTQLAFERLKQSNQGIKGIHFNLWKPLALKTERKRALLELEVDLESLEVLAKMKYKMDYVGEYGIQVVDFKSEYSISKLEDKIRKYKMEQVDSYDVANMELESDSDRDDVVCID